MKSIHNGLPGSTFDVPSGVVKATVCHDSGLLPSEQCSNLITDWFIESMVPKDHCGTANLSKEYAICEDTGLLAIEGVCPRVIYKKMGDDEQPPTENCNVHKKPEATPTPTPEATPTPTPEATPTPTPEATPTPTPVPTPTPTPVPTPTPSVAP